MTQNSNFYCLPITFGTPEFDDALGLRYKILRKPLKMEYEDNDIAKEYDSIHISCYDYHKHILAAVLILKPITPVMVKMRQVAVDTAFQSQGVGTFLVQQSEEIAKSMGYSQIELHARDTAVEFYLKLGYKPKGDVFTEVGIEHLYMYKNI